MPNYNILHQQTLEILTQQDVSISDKLQSLNGLWLTAISANETYIYALVNQSGPILPFGKLTEESKGQLHQHFAKSNDDDNDDDNWDDDEDRLHCCMHPNLSFALNEVAYHTMRDKANGKNYNGLDEAHNYFKEKMQLNPRLFTPVSRALGHSTVRTGGARPHRFHAHRNNFFSYAAPPLSRRRPQRRNTTIRRSPLGPLGRYYSRSRNSYTPQLHVNFNNSPGMPFVNNPPGVPMMSIQQIAAQAAAAAMGTASPQQTTYNNLREAFNADQRPIRRTSNVARYVRQGLHNYASNTLGFDMSEQGVLPKLIAGTKDFASNALGAVLDGASDAVYYSLAAAIPRLVLGLGLRKRQLKKGSKHIKRLHRKKRKTLGSLDKNFERRNVLRKRSTDEAIQSILQNKQKLRQIYSQIRILPFDPTKSTAQNVSNFKFPWDPRPLTVDELMDQNENAPRPRKTHAYYEDASVGSKLNVFGKRDAILSHKDIKREWAEYASRQFNPNLNWGGHTSVSQWLWNPIGSAVNYALNPFSGPDDFGFTSGPQASVPLGIDKSIQSDYVTGDDKWLVSKEKQKIGNGLLARRYEKLSRRKHKSINNAHQHAFFDILNAVVPHMAEENFATHHFFGENSFTVMPNTENTKTGKGIVPVRYKTLVKLGDQVHSTYAKFTDEYGREIEELENEDDEKPITGHFVEHVQHPNLPSTVTQKAHAWKNHLNNMADEISALNPKHPVFDDFDRYVPRMLPYLLESADDDPDKTIYEHRYSARIPIGPITNRMFVRQDGKSLSQSEYNKIKHSVFQVQNSLRDTSKSSPEFYNKMINGWNYIHNQARAASPHIDWKNFNRTLNTMMNRDLEIPGNAVYPGLLKSHLIPYSTMILDTLKPVPRNTWRNLRKAYHTAEWVHSSLPYDAWYRGIKRGSLAMLYSSLNAASEASKYGKDVADYFYEKAGNAGKQLYGHAAYAGRQLYHHAPTIAKLDRAFDRAVPSFVENLKYIPTLIENVKIMPRSDDWKFDNEVYQKTTESPLITTEKQRHRRTNLHDSLHKLELKRPGFTPYSPKEHYQRFLMESLKKHAHNTRPSLKKFPLPERLIKTLETISHTTPNTLQEFIRAGQNFGLNHQSAATILNSTLFDAANSHKVASSVFNRLKSHSAKIHPSPTSSVYDNFLYRISRSRDGGIQNAANEHIASNQENSRNTTFFHHFPLFINGEFHRPVRHPTPTSRIGLLQRNATDLASPGDTAASVSTSLNHSRRRRHRRRGGRFDRPSTAETFESGASIASSDSQHDSLSHAIRSHNEGLGERERSHRLHWSDIFGYVPTSINKNFKRVQLKRGQSTANVPAPRDEHHSVPSIVPVRNEQSSSTGGRTDELMTETAKSMKISKRFKEHSIVVDRLNALHPSLMGKMASYSSPLPINARFDHRRNIEPSRHDARRNIVNNQFEYLLNKAPEAVKLAIRRRLNVMWKNRFGIKRNTLGHTMNRFYYDALKHVYPNAALRSKSRAHIVHSDFTQTSGSHLGDVMLFFHRLWQ